MTLFFPRKKVNIIAFTYTCASYMICIDEYIKLEKAA